MRVFRLYNLTELCPASPLYFLSKAGADGYREYVRWPYAHSGRYPLRAGGSVPLADLDLRTEETQLHAVLVPTLELILIQREGLVGACHLLPGDCFNPDLIEALAALEDHDQQMGPLLAEAQLRLKQEASWEEQVKERGDPRWHL